MGLFFPGAALAQGSSQGSTQIQPALILALALTSLVLFCVYLVQKNRDEKKNRDGEKKWATQNHPVQTRLHETHKALNSLFTHPGIPMAKIDLEQGRIIEATPALFQALGYTKKSFLNTLPEPMGLLPAKENEILNLVENGWTQFSTLLCHRTTGQQITCRILNIATQIQGRPMVLSIIPDLIEEDHGVNPACDTSQFIETPS